MKTIGNIRFSLVALVTALTFSALLSLGAQSTKQQTYASPEKAAAAMFDAAKNGDVAELTKVFGPDVKGILSSGDPVADRNDRERIIQKYQEMHRWVVEPDKSVVLYLGAENWPFPIPLTQKNGVWLFDTAKGKQEILFRRIGRNEHATMDTLTALVQAQKEYASKARGNGTAGEYAQKFASDKDQQNGLYWKAAEGQPQSPIGPLVAEAAKQGYQKAAGAPVPFHGYIYRILTRQGKSAPGGLMSYVVNGKMTRGFAFISYPATYRNSGVMTFVVGKDGQIYQKDLGPDTARIAAAMTTFDPDKTWEVVEIVL